MSNSICCLFLLRDQIFIFLSIYVYKEGKHSSYILITDFIITKWRCQMMMSIIFLFKDTFLSPWYSELFSFNNILFIGIIICSNFILIGIHSNNLKLYKCYYLNYHKERMWCIFINETCIRGERSIYIDCIDPWATVTSNPCHNYLS